MSILTNIYGEDLIIENLNYLTVSRQGLRISDLSVLVGESWNNESFAEATISFGTPLVVSHNNILMISTPHLKQVLLELIDESEIESFHRDLANRFINLNEFNNLRITETMFHLLMGGQLELAAEYLSNVKGSEILSASTALAGFINSNESNKEKGLSLLNFEVSNSFDLRRRFLNEVFISLVQNNSLADAELIVDTIDKELKEIMGERNTIDNILILSLTLMRKASISLYKNEVENVKNYFDNSIGIIERLLSQDPDSNNFSLSNYDTLFNLGMICLEMNQEKGAFYFFDKAFSLLDNYKDTKEDDILSIAS